MTKPSRKPVEAAPPRLSAMAKLPVFFNLEGKRAVMAGGTPAAAWKVELLAACGAHVEIYADQISNEMSGLLARGAAAGSLKHHRRTWSADIFPGAVLALADAETDAEALAFFSTAVAAGVPVNVIDKPVYCQFQFGSIVNRSPVVIGISTDGAAPVLAQAIRRRIETLLPPWVAAWGKLAKELRNVVTERLSPGPQRRLFWETFSERAFGNAPKITDAATALQLIDEVACGVAATKGRITLVGAGPGDPELLTLKAIRALQSADVILFDDLVSDEVLELARREAKRMLVGKRGGRESCRQDDINELMIKLAKQGKHVVRLKSGDPMIFGRAGEEIERLERESISVSVVPGISAAVAMASELGLSLTHRDCAHSVRFVTGHSRAGKLPDDLDWKGLADPDTTLVFYMGGRTTPQIAKRLIAEGLQSTTPVVIATAISRPNGHLQFVTLSEAAQGATVVNSGEPVLVGIGAAFAGRIPKVSSPAHIPMTVQAG